jgi:hypothetical protein
VPGQNDPGTVVMSVPLSVHPHSGVLHGAGVAGGGVEEAMFVTSVSNTHPASPPELEPLDEPLEEPLEDPLDEPLEEPLEDPLDDELPPSFPVAGLPPLEPPQPATAKLAAEPTMRSASAPRIQRRLMCRFRWRPGWAC